MTCNLWSELVRELQAAQAIRALVDGQAEGDQNQITMGAMHALELVLDRISAMVDEYLFEDPPAYRDRHAKRDQPTVQPPCTVWTKDDVSPACDAPSGKAGAP